MTRNRLKAIFERTIKNCEFLERENKIKWLCNEIGALRGIAYCLELSGICPHTSKFLYYINLQNELLKTERHL